MGSLNVLPQQTKQKSLQTSFRRISTSVHNLHSPRQHHHIQQDYIYKKWKYHNYQQANKKYYQLKIKQENLQDYVIAIQDLQINQIWKNNYQVKAKIQFSDHNLKTDIQKKCQCFSSYDLSQIWNMANRITQIVAYLIKNSIKVPHEMSNYLLIGSKIKVKDFSLFPGLKSDKKSLFSTKYSKIICRIITNLGLLTTSTQDVTLIQINRINLKYNPNIATYLYTIHDKQLSIQQIIQLQYQMSQINKIQFQKFVFKTQSKSNLYLDLKAKKQAQFSNYIAQTDQKILKYSSVQSPQMYNSVCSENIVKSNRNYKRLQQIKPKQFKNYQLINIIKQEQNKQNQQYHNNQQQNKIKHGNVIDIDDHSFPQKVKKVKQFRKTSATLSDTSSRISQQRNQAFIRLTGGQKCELFAQNNQQSLLQSIFQSQQSVIIKNSQSPVLNLDQQIQSITSDFMKLQPPFLQPQKYEQKSIFQFQQHRNSTIIEVTEQQQQSHQKSKYHQIKSQFLNSLEQNYQKFCSQEFQENQDKFVIESYQGGSRYEGYTVNGLRNGFGKLYYEDGGSYEGLWRNGQIEGVGKLFYQSGQLAYEGNWQNGEFHGQGKIINQCPETIQGKFNYRDLSDIGASWLWYQGNFQHDNKHGNGILLLSNGQQFSGIWHRNNVEGEGIFIKRDGFRVQGRWSNNNKPVIKKMIFENKLMIKIASILICRIQYLKLKLFMGLFYLDDQNSYTTIGTSNWTYQTNIRKQSIIKATFQQNIQNGMSQFIDLYSDNQSIYFYCNDGIKSLNLSLTVMQQHYYYIGQQSKSQIQYIEVYEIKLKNRKQLTKIYTINYQQYIKLYNHLLQYTILIQFQKHFKILNQIGQGSFSKVYNGINIVNKQIIALKIFCKQFIQHLDYGQAIINNQIINLQKLRKFKLSPLIGVYQTNNSIIIALKRAQAGNMLNYLKYHAQDYNQQLIKNIIYKILYKLKQLHSAGFIHRDIKPANIFFCNYQLNSEVFLGDFGCSVMKKDLKYSKIGKISSGTLGFIAPQIIKNNYYNQMCDIFSLGSLFYFLLTGSPIFSKKAANQIYQLVNDDQIIQSYINSIFNISHRCKDLLKKMLKVNHQERISAQLALKHKYFEGIKVQSNQNGEQNITLASYLQKRVEKYFQQV